VPGGTEPSAADPTPPEPTTRKERRRQRSRRHRWWLLAGLAVVVAAAGSFVAVRATAPIARPGVRSVAPASLFVPGVTAPFPWPAAGQAAVAVPSLGYAAQSGPETPIPVASLTKMTTAIVILRDHPLAPGAAGPLITISADDAAQFGDDTADDQSTVPLAAGEQLSEQQMLEALLLPSANDVAYALAEWDAGSQAAFVAKMNATAADLGATATHYVDASGFDPGSVSTAADCLKIAAAGMQIPAFAAIVAMPSAQFPMVGTITNVIGGVGTDEIVGVKSGFTSPAGGCLVLAANRTVGHRQVQVLVAVLAQPVVPPPPPPPAGATKGSTTTTSTSTSTTTTTTTTTTTLPPNPGPSTSAPASAPAPLVPASTLDMSSVFQFAGPAALTLVTAVESSIGPVTVTSPGTVVATVVATWGGSRHVVAVRTTSSAELLARPGQRVDSMARIRHVPAGARVGGRVGFAYYWLGTQLAAVPLRLASTVREPSWWWRVVHG
jgi:serine-type D-Ala-D-Ala carboxypeptidase (penicillin-binding protein 5/6)